MWPLCAYSRVSPAGSHLSSLSVPLGVSHSLARSAFLSCCYGSGLALATSMSAPRASEVQKTLNGPRHGRQRSGSTPCSIPHALRWRSGVAERAPFPYLPPGHTTAAAKLGGGPAVSYRSRGYAAAAHRPLPRTRNRSGRQTCVDHPVEIVRRVEDSRVPRSHSCRLGRP